jgi:hypothetical protein
MARTMLKYILIESVGDEREQEREEKEKKRMIDANEFMTPFFVF